jgi:ATPase subunit of ABC transporter with duplicated ATPase domains
MCSTCFSQGNFDSYIKTRAELEENQMKQYNSEQDQIKHMKVGIIIELHICKDISF